MGTNGCNQVSASLNPVVEGLADFEATIQDADVQPEIEDVVSALEDLDPDYCLACHIDKDRLIETAKVEEVVVSESSGEG